MPLILILIHVFLYYVLPIYKALHCNRFIKIPDYKLRDILNAILYIIYIFKCTYKIDDPILKKYRVNGCLVG